MRPTPQGAAPGAGATFRPIRRPLLLILLLFSLVTLYQSAMLPLGEAADETDHYQYLRFVARTGHPPLSEAERQAAGFKGGLAPLYYWLTAWPIALVGPESRPDVRRVDARPERHIPTDGLGINHVLHTLDEQWPWRGQVLAWHLVRFLSLPLGWITILATAALARRLWPARPVVAVVAAAFVALLPRFVGSSAVINDDNLVFALISLLLLVQAAILQQGRRASARLFALFGALFGLTLVTKYFSLILIPETLFTLAAYWWTAGPALPGQNVPAAQRSRQDSSFTFQASSRPVRLRRVILFLLTLLLTAGPWFAFIILRFNRINELGLIPGLAASLGEPQVTEGLVGLLSGQSVRPVAATYGLLRWFGLLYRSFWFEFGWMEIFAPTWIYVAFTLFLLAALAGLATKMMNGRTANGEAAKQRSSEPKGRDIGTFPSSHPPIPPSSLSLLLSLHLLLFLLVVLARYILSATIDTGQGRHLYPALPVIACLIAAGLSHLGLKIYQARSTNRVAWPTLLLFPALFYLLPATLCLLPGLYILPNYRTLPVTVLPPAGLPIRYPQTIEFAGGLFLAGFDMGEAARAGNALPVRLYWRAAAEATRDYLVSACLLDEGNRPAACWRGHFVDGRYPARAWEAGDTIVDTVSIPIPACYRLSNHVYRLRLELWPLRPDLPQPTPTTEPVLQQTFQQPEITIRPTDSLRTLPQSADLWLAGRRLAAPAQIEPGQTLAYIRYAAAGETGSPALRRIEAPQARWLPAPGLDTSLYLPCADGPTPFAHLSHFVAGPSLPGGQYRPEDAAPADIVLTLFNRSRSLAPLQSDLTFGPYLSPLSLTLPGELVINPIRPPTRIHPLPQTDRLPVTIRWQARRWMAEPLIISLKLLDKDFAVGGERIAALGDRYPNVLWAPTEIVEETYPVQVSPDAPPGLYRLELSLLRQDESLPDGYEYLPLNGKDATSGNNLYLVTLRRLDPAHYARPSRPFSARVGSTIRLTGYDLVASPAADEPHTVHLVLYWHTGAAPGADYTVFTQLVGPGGQVWAQWDNPPQAGRYPTGAWTWQDVIVDRYTLTLRDGAPPGPYRLLVGMYDPATGNRLPVTIDGQPQPDNAIQVASIEF